MTTKAALTLSDVIKINKFNRQLDNTNVHCAKRKAIIFILAKW